MQDIHLHQPLLQHLELVGSTRVTLQGTEGHITPERKIMKIMDSKVLEGDPGVLDSFPGGTLLDGTLEVCKASKTRSCSSMTYSSRSFEKGTETKATGVLYNFWVEDWHLISSLPWLQFISEY